MTVLATLKDGRIIAKATFARTSFGVPVAPAAISVTISDLRKVENLLSVNLDADANVGVDVSGISIYGNVVGVTLIPATGTTVSGEIVAIGY